MIITTLPYLFPLKPGKVYHNGEFFLFTLASLVVTLPITIYHFQRLSLVALLANPLVLPSQPAVMVLGGLAVLLGWVSLPLGKLAALFAWPFTAYTIRAVELLARIPGGNLVLGPMGLLVVALAYALLFAGTWAVVHRPAWMVVLKPKPAPVLVALIALTAWVWRMALAAPDGRLHLVLLDVGSGDAILIQTPAGATSWLMAVPAPEPSRRPSAGAAAGQAADRLAGGGCHREGAVQRAAGYVGPLPAAERAVGGATGWQRPGPGSTGAFRRQRDHPLVAQTGQVLDLGSGAVLRVDWLSSIFCLFPTSLPCIKWA